MSRRAALMILGLLSCRSRTLPPQPPTPPVGPAAQETAGEHLRMGKPDLALELLDANLSRFESAEGLRLLGQALRMRGRHSEARFAFERALALRDEAPTRRELAALCLETEDYPAAARHLRAVPLQAGDAALLEFLEGFRGRPHEVLAGERAALPLADSGLPQVPVRLEGIVESSFLVDTGASFSVLSVSLAKRIGMFSKVEGGILLDLEGKPLKASFGVVESLRLGGLHVARVPVLLVDDDALRFRLFGLHAVHGVEGVLGMSLLRRFRMTFDFEAGALSLHAAGAETLRGGFPLLGTGLNLYARISIEGGEDLTFRIDTGANQSSLTSWGLDRAGLAGRAIPRVDFVAGAEGWGASLREVSGIRMEWGGFRLLDLRLPVLAASDPTGLQVAGVVGTDLLRHFRVTLDPYLMAGLLERIDE